MIEITNLSKRFGNKTVLAPLTLKFETARTHVLLGPSGCGKSTLLRLIMGLISPDSGEIQIDSEKLTVKNQKQIAPRLGYVLQDGGLFPHLTARRNVTLVADLMGWSTQKQKDRLEQLRELVPIESEALDRYPKHLSGGQKQRISLLRALMTDPAILILDEPLGALDPITRLALQIELRAVFRRLEKTVILVTHDLNEAAYFGDRIVLLNEGRVEQEGGFRDFWQRPASSFVSDFVRAQLPSSEMRGLE